MMKIKPQLSHLPSLGYLTQCSLGFNGERQDRVIGSYFLGNGYRVYNPRIKRFQAYDRLSPFEQGGINGYAYCLGDPINIRDPSGHFAILGLLIGAIIGAVVGATISAAAEGIRTAVTPTAFDWKPVSIGAALGFISGGFGTAAKGLKMGCQFELANHELAKNSPMTLDGPSAFIPASNKKQVFNSVIFGRNLGEISF